MLFDDHAPSVKPSPATNTSKRPACSPSSATSLWLKHQRVSTVGSLTATRHCMQPTSVETAHFFLRRQKNRSSDVGLRIPQRWPPTNCKVCETKQFAWCQRQIIALMPSHIFANSISCQCVLDSVSFVMFVCLSLYSLLPDLWWIKLFNIIIWFYCSFFGLIPYITKDRVTSKFTLDFQNRRDIIKKISVYCNNSSKCTKVKYR